MSTEYRVVPVELLQHFVDTLEAAHICVSGDAELREILAVPVPPAGGAPEVPVFDGWLDGCAEMTEIVCAEHHRARINRLQAELSLLEDEVIDHRNFFKAWKVEREALQSELINEKTDTVKRLEWAKEAAARIDILESELTKARELLNLLYWGNTREPTEADCDEIEHQINAGLAHQSAPAAKEVRLLSVADDMSTCTLSNGDGQGYFYDRIEDDKS